MKSDGKNDAGGMAKLAAYKDASQGTRTFTLVRSGVEVTVPTFISHRVWMRAVAAGGGDVPKAQLAYVAEVATFEGDRLTLTDIAELLDAADGRQLVAETFSGPLGRAGAAGNGETATAH